MINIKVITARNFLSIGNVTQVIDFSQPGVTLVLGQNLDVGTDDSENRNGAGKTAAINALCYALYGDPIGKIKKDSLINLINKKNMLVTVDFEKDSINYRIERGRKPGILKFYINNQEIAIDNPDDVSQSQGENKETQADIESIIGMSKVMFEQIVALNAISEPFLSMAAGPQRVIIEQLLGITILSEKAEALKTQTKELKDQIFQETATINAVVKANDHINDTIKSLKLKQTLWFTNHEASILETQKTISRLQSLDIDKELENHKLLAGYQEQRRDIAEIERNIEAKDRELSSMINLMSKKQLEISELGQQQCPTCHQHLHSAAHQELMSAANSQLNDLGLQAEYLEADIQLWVDRYPGVEISKPDTPVYSSIDQAYRHQYNLQSAISTLEAKSQEQDIYQDQIDELTNTALQPVCWDTVNELTRLVNHYEFLTKLLTNKDSFIRKRIIDQNLHYLNSRLGFYLDQIGLPHQVFFQNDLSVQISLLGQEIDFHNLSRGERTRLVLSLSFAFRDVWEGLYHKLNLMVIDELVDNGLDSSGIESALSLLKTMGRDQNKSVFLVSHRRELLTRVNNILYVIKENNFTRYEPMEQD